MDQVDHEEDYIDLKIDESDYSSSEESSESSQFENTSDDRYVFNYPPNPTKLYYPRRPSNCTNGRKASLLSNDSLSGEKLYFTHGLVMRVDPLPPTDLGDIRLRNNNSRKVATHNHSSYDYVCHLEGGRFVQENTPLIERD